MAESYLSDHGDRIGTNTNGAFNSFFRLEQWKCATPRQTRIVPPLKAIPTLGVGSATEPDFIDFSADPRSTTDSNGRAKIEYRIDSGPGDKVVFTNNIADAHQIFQYDSAPQNQERNTEAQEKTRANQAARRSNSKLHQGA